MSQNLSDRIAAKAEFKCAECGKQHALDEADFDFLPRAAGERQEGETRHASAHEVVCGNCRKAMHLTFEVWKNPDGKVSATCQSVDNVTEVRFQLGHKAAPRQQPQKHSVRYDEYRPLFLGLGGAAWGGALTGSPIVAIIGGILSGMLVYSLNASNRR